jgi:hypothetical protein
MRFQILCAGGEYRYRNTVIPVIVTVPVEPANFTGGYVTTALGHEADTALRIRRLEGVDVVDERRLRRYFKVPDHAVALKK